MVLMTQEKIKKEHLLFDFLVENKETKQHDLLERKNKKGKSLADGVSLSRCYLIKEEEIQKQLL